MSNSKKRASRLVKKSQLITDDQLPTQKPDQAYKSTAINDFGEAVANYDRSKVAKTAGKKAANFADKVISGLTNRTLWMVEHATVDTVKLVSDVAEVGLRKSWNGGIALGEAAKDKESENVQRLTAKVYSDVQEVKALGTVAKDGVVSRWQDGVSEIQQARADRKDAQLEADLKAGKDLRSPWQKLSDRVHQYAGTEQPQAVLENSGSEPLALPESVATTPMGKLVAQEVAKA